MRRFYDIMVSSGSKANKEFFKAHGFSYDRSYHMWRKKRITQRMFNLVCQRFGNPEGPGSKINVEGIYLEEQTNNDIYNIVCIAGSLGQHCTYDKLIKDVRRIKALCNRISSKF